jgi:hypothetical protein
MATKKKMLQASAGNATGGDPLDIDEVFSTYLYDGAGSTQTITNGIDLDGEGGLVWIKGRSGTYAGHNDYGRNILVDTVRGNTSALSSSDNVAAITEHGASYIASFNSNGFSVGGATAINEGSSLHKYASWTWRKAPKFFDVQTWSGDGTSNRAIPHNLKGAVGSYFVKCTSHGTNSDWVVWHKDNWSGANSFHQVLNSTAAVQNSNIFSSTAPDTSNVYLGTSNLDFTNSTGRTYVGYFFAHNDGDGEFGPDSDQDIIKCGIYNGNGASQEINIGFEPQWLLIKRKNSGEDWIIYDSMRNWRTSKGGSGDSSSLEPNTSDAEQEYTRIHPSANGFGFDSEAGSWSNASGGQYVYIAIRRGPLAPPTAGTEVYKTVVPTANRSDSPEPYWNSGFTVDMAIHRPNAGSTQDTFILSRLTGENKGIDTNTGNEENGLSFKADMLLDYNTGVHSNTGYGASAGSEDILHMFKRAPGHFDAVCYSGNGTAGRTIGHNLGVAPELLIVKRRDGSGGWKTYVESLGPTKALTLNETVGAENQGSSLWNSTSPTADVFTVGTNNQSNSGNSGYVYIAYLFASCPGVSKVGSYTGNGTSQTIDCSFTSGARFILIKRTDTHGDWNYYTSARAIVAGNDIRTSLNTTDAEDNSNDRVDPSSSGFIVNYNANGTSDSNISGASYIFYAIA